MKKISFFLLLAFFVTCKSFGQDEYLANLRRKFSFGITDSIRSAAGFALTDYYYERNRDSSLKYANEVVLLCAKNNKKINKAWALSHRAYQQMQKGQYQMALPDLLEAFSIAEDPANEEYYWHWYDSTMSSLKLRRLTLSFVHHMYGVLMSYTGNRQMDIFHTKEARKIALEINDTNRILLADMNLGNRYLHLDKIDSALYFEKEAEQLAISYKSEYYLSSIYSTLAESYFKKKDTVSGKQYSYHGIRSGLEQNNPATVWPIYWSLADIYIQNGEKDSSLYYATKMMQTIQSMGKEYSLGEGYHLLYRCYKLRNQFDSAFKYQGLALVAKDSLHRQEIKNLTSFQNLSFNEQLRLKQLEEERVKERNKIRTYFLYGGIGILFLLALIFYKNNRQKHKAKIKIEQAYDNLKATQQQLIQSEKMASLGELTAGIAHEIQNPLNFVNNFSEVNKELLAEMNEEILKGNFDEAKAIAKDITDNEEKINHHGKRADTIVKGMLQHSRSSSGQKEPTDINALTDEYLRLAYHGLRAKDKSFNTTMKTDFDESISNINIIPQDIGRVVLNLINNAFYVVDEKKKQSQNGYNPIVSVSTKRVNGKVEISVKDNGNGIPQKVLDKIFQPFFTTKPTGQGTGLGLSLSYDIVKAHGGELKVETKEGEGSVFVITLPATFNN
jgi:two-component system NtrC family sensor kinase